MAKTSKELRTDISNLKYALDGLLDMYLQLVDNACQCSNMYSEEDETDQECSYCYAKRVLKETK